jgi:ABC-type glycerol-3-phosphate transport system substrate-binding protein
VRQKKRERLCLLLAGLLCALALLSVAPSAPGSKRERGADSRTQLRFWHSIGTYNKEVLNSLVDAYNRENGDVRVTAVFQGTADEVYLKLLSNENLPDIVQLPVEYLPALEEKGVLTDVGSFIPNKLRDDIAKKFWASVTIDGKVWGMPFFYTVSLLFVNQHILRSAGVRQDEEPQSWGQILSVAEKIRENTREKWALYIPMETAAQFVAFVQSYTGTQVYRGGRMLVDAPETAEAMKYLQDLVFVLKEMPPRITVDEGVGLFLAGNLGMMLASSSLLVYTESNLPYDMGVWHLPGKKTSPPAAMGYCLALVRTSPKREREAYRFVDYMTSQQSSIKWHTHSGSPAIRTSVRDSIDLLIFYEDSPNHMSSTIELDRARVYNPPLDFLRASKKSFDYFGFTRTLKKALEEIMINGGNPAEILGAAQREIDSLK